MLEPLEPAIPEAKCLLIFQLHEQIDSLFKLR